MQHRDNVIPIIGKPKMHCSYCGDEVGPQVNPGSAFNHPKLRTAKNVNGIRIVCFLCIFKVLDKFFNHDEVKKENENGISGCNAGEEVQ